VARDLELCVGAVKCPRAVGATGVLRADEFFQDIQVRALKPHAKTEPNRLRERADLGNEPAQDVCRKDDCWGYIQTRIFAAGAGGAGG
jgi:hypothetical protein